MYNTILSAGIKIWKHKIAYALFNYKIDFMRIHHLNILQAMVEI